MDLVQSLIPIGMPNGPGEVESLGARRLDARDASLNPGEQISNSGVHDPRLAYTHDLSQEKAGFRAIRH